MAEVRSEMYDAVVVGAGFSGMYMLHRLRQSGLTVRLLEAGKGPGGVWYWNRYPGARCDVFSTEYQYGFDNELMRGWTWSEHYGTQPEILEYVDYVAERLRIGDDADYDTRVKSAVWDDSERLWTLTTDTGRSLRASFCIMATGHLSAANTPDIPGRELFEGRTFHTGEWPHEGVDFHHRTVGIIGTGSSGVQSIPHIAEQAKHLYVFQRTAAFSMPVENTPVSAEEAAKAKEQFPTLRENARYTASLNFYPVNTKSVFDYSPAEAEAIMEDRWRRGGFAFLQGFSDVLTDVRANDVAAEFFRRKIRQKVKDPKIAELLMPNYPVGTKRPCLDSGYYETFNRPNVTLVDVRAAPIAKITPSGLVSGDKEYKLDDIIFATGFDAMTGALSRIDIRGENGIVLKEKWAEGPITYLGLGSAGFPNMFFMSGPGSPSVLANCIAGSEYQVEWIDHCIDYMRKHDCRSIAPTQEAERAWGLHVNEVASTTLLSKTDNWYLGANIPGKPRVFMPYPGFGNYRKRCEAVEENEYEGFVLN